MCRHRRTLGQRADRPYRVESERGYIRLTRLNDIYREELIELRRRVRNDYFVVYSRPTDEF